MSVCEFFAAWALAGLLVAILFGAICHTDDP